MKKFRRELYSLHDFEMQEALSSMEGRDVAAVEVATVDNLGDDQFRYTGSDIHVAHVHVMS